MIDTEEKARKKVNDTWNAKELFIILSESQLRDLFSIVNTALYLGVTHTDIDCLTDDAMNIKLIALMDWNGRKPENISMIMTKEEYERMKAGGKLGVRFNEMPLFNVEI